MARNTVYTESVVTLNNQEATARLDELKAKVKELDAAMSKLDAEGVASNTKEYQKLQKEMNSTLKAMGKVTESSKKFKETLNNINGASINELQQAANQLNKQLRSLKPSTDEFVAASKKLQQVKDRMSELQGTSKQAQSMLGGFFSKIGWAGLIAGAIGLIKKFGQEMIAQTQMIGDVWDQFTGGIKQAWGSFVTGISSGQGFKELLSNMRESFRVGKDVAAVLDEIFERQNSLAIKESEYNIQIEKNKQAMKDVNLSNEERLAASEDAIRLENELADERVAVAQQELEANKRLFQDRTKMNDAELEAFVKEYNNNRDLINQAIEYSEAVKEQTKNLKNRNTAAAAKDALADLEQNTSEEVKKMADITYRYNLANDELTEKYVQSVVKVNQAEASRYSTTTRLATQSFSLRKAMATEAQKAQEDAYKAAIKVEDDHIKERENKAKQAYANGEISEQEYQNRLSTIQEEGLKNKLSIAERYKQSTIEYQSKLLDLTIKQKEDLQKILDQVEKEALSVSSEMIKNSEEELETIMADIDADIQAQTDKLVEDMAEAEKIFDELHPLDALKSQMDAELANLDNLHEQGLLSEEDYQAKRKEIVTSFSKQIQQVQLQDVQQGIETAGMFLDQAAALVSTIQQAGEARLDAEMQKELTAAGDNAEAREEIEKKYEQRKLDLQKKYANINMGIQIAQTIASGAQAAIKALAELGPVAGGIMAGIIAATTAAQVAVIVAQRNAVMNQSIDNSGSTSGTAEIGNRVATDYESNGYAEGGYTSRKSNDYQPVGVVHANEWVAPAAMVRAHPVTFAKLEAERLSGHYSSELRGFASGGRTSPDGAPAAVTGIDSADIQKLNELLDKLMTTPIKAYVIPSEINKENEVEQKFKSMAGK